MTAKVYKYTVRSGAKVLMSTDDLNAARQWAWMRPSEERAVIQYSCSVIKNLMSRRLPDKDLFEDVYELRNTNRDGVIRFITVIPSLKSGAVPHEYSTFIPNASLKLTR